MRYTKEEKLQYVSAWQATKLSRKQFSITNELCYASFLKWTKQYQEQKATSFIKLEDKAEDKRQVGTKIVLPNGVLIQTEQSITDCLLKVLSNV